MINDPSKQHKVGTEIDDLDRPLYAEVLLR